MWSYGNLFRDQPDLKSGSREGKEICDLLVVFGRDVVIFSDKDCAFDSSIDVRTAWRRWYRKAVFGSVKQIYGAERWILEEPERIYTDNACQHPFPIALPSPDQIRIHRVAVVHSIAGPCAQHFGGGSGSLILDTTIVRDDHFGEDCAPFRTGIVGKEGRFVHVLDDTTVEILLRELDTIDDFVKYLVKKELLLADTVVQAPGEENLLADYLSSIDDRGEHNFSFAGQGGGVILDEASWAQYLASPQVARKKTADEVSYVWDRLIEEFARHMIAGTQHYTTHPGIRGGEPAVRMMAQIGRYERRMMGANLVDFLEKYGRAVRVKGVRVMWSSGRPNLAFVILLLSRPTNRPYEDYRTLRRHLLELCCLGIKVRFPESEDIVSIGLDAGSHEHRSEDLFYFDAREWDHSQDAQVNEELQAFDLFQSDIRGGRRKGGMKEYPDAPQLRIKMKNRDANRLCPCGSGKKFKRCHGVR